MNNDEATGHVAAQGLKIAGVWAAIGITSWADAASFVAFILSVLALAEWVWKKVIKPMIARRRAGKPQHNRRHGDRRD